MTKNHGGGIIGAAIIEKRSLRRNHWKKNHREEIIEERGIWKASGRHPGGIREAPGRLQETPGGRCPCQLECKSCVKILILHNVFEGQITKYYKLQAKMLPGSVDGATAHLRPPWYSNVRTPTDKFVWGKTSPWFQDQRKSVFSKNHHLTGRSFGRLNKSFMLFGSKRSCWRDCLHFSALFVISFL